MAEAAQAIPVQAVAHWTRRDLARLFAACSPRSLILDLCRRGLTPFFAADQICRRFGLDLSAMLADLPEVLLPDAGSVEARHIGSWIDFELFGDSARIVADRVCQAISGKGIDHLVVLMPATIDDLPRADAMLVAGLVRQVDAMNGRVTLAFPGGGYDLPADLCIDCTVPQGKHEVLLPATLPPGPISPAFRSKLDMLGYKAPPAVAAPDDMSYFAACDRFSAAPRVPQTLMTYAENWGWRGLPFTLDALDARQTALFAWRAIGARDADLATCLVELAASRSGDRTFAQTTLATIHIINQTYDALAEIAPHDATGQLNRAWGATLSGDADAAVATFAQAQDTDNPVIALYLRNIAALAHFRAGDLATAWKKQYEIRDALKHLHPPSPHLFFINNLNLSRLSRAAGDLAEARRYLEAAIAARASGTSEHDDLYAEVLRAGVSGGTETARQHWVRACTIFEAQGHAGAISRRAFRSITGRNPRKFELREIAVREALYRKARMPEAVS